MILRAINKQSIHFWKHLLSIDASGNYLNRRSAKVAFSSLTDNPNLTNNLELFDSKHHDALNQVTKSMLVIPDFIDHSEEKLLLDEVENVLKRIRYEQSHWDDAIHNYRETEHIRWRNENKKIIDRVRNVAFSRDKNLIKYVHILDIAKDGHIKAHIDSVRFCGDTIAGISLLSTSVMRLVLDSDKSMMVDILLNNRSLYIMTGDARYKYTHEILDNKNSYFRDRHVPRDRRISIICRNEPIEVDEDTET